MKNKQIRKLLSVLLAATMAASAPATVWGANSAPQDALPAATEVAAASTMDKHGVTTDLVVKASSNEGIGYDIDGYRVDKNGVRYIYLFLSSKADMGAVNVTFSDGSTDTLDLTAPIDCNFDSGQYRIVAMQSDLPTLYLNIDESQGTIDAMNSDPSHDTKCKGEMLLDVPDKLVEQNGWDTSYASSDVTVKGRGNTTWGLPKKPYQIKLDSKQDILGMGKNKTWVLLANYGDRSLIRNKIAYDLANDLGMDYSPQSQFVDVFMNGQYLGNYQLSEKTEVGTNRVEINDLEDDTSGEITGGYLLEYDRLAYSEATWITGSQTHMPITVKSPEFATPEQKAYIQEYVNDMENAIFGENGLNDKGKHYTEYIDAASFDKLYWVNEIVKNGDYSYGSTYMYKDKDKSPEEPSLMYGGPVWDFDIAMANAVANAGATTPDRQQNLASPEGWWLRTTADGIASELFMHQDYRALNKEMYETTVRPLLQALPQKAEEYAAQIRSSADMNFVRWDVLEHGHQWATPNTATTYEGEVAFVKDYLQKRANWIDWAMGDEHFLDGEGTQENPYLIRTEEDLTLLSSSFKEGSPYAGAYFKQTNDIDLENQEWSPIGTSSKPFTGVYDGGGYSIQNLKITSINSTSEAAGFFGVIKNATVQNLRVESGSIHVTAQDAAAVVGRMSDSKVLNCSNSASVTNNASSGHQMTGGVVGHAVSPTVNSIVNCYNTGTISAPNAVGGTNCRGVGGVAGHISGTTPLVNCYNTGKVTAAFGLNGYIGGVVGEQSSTASEVKNCYWVTDGQNGIAQGKGTQQSSNSGEGTKYSATGMTSAQMAEESFVQTLNNGREEAAAAAGVDLSQISPWSYADGAPILTPEQDVPAITVVGLLETMNVDNGTEFSALPLPTTVQVSLSNNKTMDVPVTWAEGSYDSATQGSYTLTGTIGESDLYTNPQNLTASITVNVSAPALPSLVSIANPAPKTVEYGTVYDALGLPAGVMITLSNGKSTVHNVNWTGHYDGNTPGTYTLTGVLEAIGTFTNPQNLTASVTITVKEKPVEIPTVTSVETLEPITVEYGTPFDSLDLPASVTVGLSDGTTGIAKVQWSGDYDSSTPGTYTLTGTLGEVQEFTNPQGLTASVSVTVKEQVIEIPFIESVGALADKTVAYGTSFDALSLPPTVTVALSNQETVQADVIWSAEGYRADQAGSYTLTGTIAVSDQFTNPNNLAASIHVTVLAEVEPSDGNKTVLKAVLDYAKAAMAGEEYAGAITSVQKSFAAAYDHALAVYDNPSAAQSEIDGAWIALMSEIHKLGFQRGDEAQLETLVAQALGLDLTQYVAAGQPEFTAALTAAQELLATGDAMQDEIDTAVNALLDAMLSLRYKADKALLAQTLSQASSIDLSGFTPLSVEAFNSAKQAAEEVYRDASLSVEDQAKVDAVQQALTAAIRGLVPVSGDSTAAAQASSPKTGEAGMGLAAAALLAGSSLAVMNRKKRRK